MPTPVEMEVRSRKDSWGMYYDNSDDSEGSTEAKMSVRDAWQMITSNLGRSSYGFIPLHKRSDITCCLIKWNNPHPSVSVKHVSNILSPEENYFTCDAMETSCHVTGFRIVQNVHGNIYAEFCLSFAYGSRSFLNWKSYTDFLEYIRILKEVHKIQPIFTQTLMCWEELQLKLKWGRCLSVKYLMEKSILLSHVAQTSFLESPTPALLFEFVQYDAGR